ncbi:MAG: YCF48-related protein, partial [Syntrophothermus sp.]
NSNEGWASAFNFSTTPYGTILLHTTNGGNSWQTRLYPQENIFIHCLYFLDSLNGWAGGSPHALARTTDGGITWQQAAIDTSTLAFFPVEFITFYDRKFGYASGGIFDVAGVIWSTDNGGDTWRAIDNSQAPADEVHGLYCFDSLQVMGAGGDPDFGYGVGMIRTDDGGFNWVYQELSIQGTAHDLDFRNDNEVWAPLGSRRTMIYSLDAGATWSEVVSADSSAIIQTVFPDSLHGYAIGNKGAFLKYKNKPTGVSVKESYGMKIYPNPGKGMVTIHPGKSSGGYKISIFDLAGQEVLHTTILPGAENVHVDVSGLAAGIYIVRSASRSAILSVQ